eukprot:scaffold3977_cov107-Isochrysis_galbana.AAC.2
MPWRTQRSLRPRTWSRSLSLLPASSTCITTPSRCPSATAATRPPCTSMASRASAGVSGGDVTRTAVRASESASRGNSTVGSRSTGNRSMLRRSQPTRLSSREELSLAIATCAACIYCSVGPPLPISGGFT